MAANPRRADVSAGPVSIGRVMARLMSRSGYDREQSNAALEAAWSQAVPEAIRAGSQPGLVRRGVLEVFVSHSTHVQELGFHKQAIVARLRELVPDAGVSDIRCRIRPDAGHGT